MSEIDPARPGRRRRARRRPAPTLLVCEGVGGLLVPLTPDYLVRNLAADLGFPLVVVASPGLGTINHTLLTIEAAWAAELEVRGRRADALARGAVGDGALQPARRSPGWAPVEVLTLPEIDLADPAGWPELELV